MDVKVKTPVDGYKTITTDKGYLKQIPLHSYIAVLTEIDGHEVKAVRYDGYETREAVHNDVISEWPDWKIKGIWRLHDTDF